MPLLAVKIGVSKTPFKRISTLHLIQAGISPKNGVCFSYIFCIYNTELEIYTVSKDSVFFFTLSPFPPC